MIRNLRCFALAVTTTLAFAPIAHAAPIPADNTIDLQFSAIASGNIINFVNPGTSFAATGSLTPLDCSACVLITSPLDIISQTNPTLDITLAATDPPPTAPRPG